LKPDIHPEYRDVVFQDTSSDLKFLTRSTIDSNETIEWEDGKTYPLAKVEISSQSHPFYTGKQILVDSGGRVERFRKRYAKTGTASATGAPAAAAPAPARPQEAADKTAEDDAPAAADEA
jgi:large subunit ribosomal protein L31